MRRQQVLETHIQKLVDAFPVLFNGGQPRCWCHYGEGWNGLLYALCTKLAETIRPGEITVAQIKEKLGTLRFYVDFNQRESEDYLERWHLISNLIAETERQSAITCETCGKEAVPRSGGWIQTLCDEHSEGRPERIFPQFHGRW
jgi:hypothetical protein